MVDYVAHGRCGRIDPVRALPSPGNSVYTSARVVLTLQAGSPVVSWGCRRRPPPSILSRPWLTMLPGARSGRIDPVRGLPSSGNSVHTSARVTLTLQAGSPVVAWGCSDRPPPSTLSRPWLTMWPTEDAVGATLSEASRAQATVSTPRPGCRRRYREGLFLSLWTLACTAGQSHACKAHTLTRGGE
jgi:hypothetical protein